ncbi:MAG: hypothetical protein [Microvirus sp.]|nr:MAG: hypothetical protein [Microvirus sp.]
MIQRYIRTEMSRSAALDDLETFDENDDLEEDFDDDGNSLPMTHHQVIAMSEQELRGVAASYGVDLESDSAPGQSSVQVPQETVPAAPPATAQTPPG